MSRTIAQQASDELRRRAAGETINPVQFLKHYWHRRPLLVRGAFPAFGDPVSRDELAGLSCEEDVESRLVMERGGAKPWQVIPGPQKVARLRKLPKSHWTLLVQGVDRYIPDVAALLEPFRFIPDWRVDDVMISFASHGGTVGPHIDSYDVFLLQGQGRRRWRLDPKAPPALRPGLDLRILRQFHAKMDWTLESGDMLYLPPNLAHYGVALDECLTYSIGFRSPSAMDLLASAHERLLERDAIGGRYTDAGLRMARDAGEIPREAIRDLRLLLEGTLSRLSATDFDALVGETLTEPKGSVTLSKRHVSPAQLLSHLKKGAAFVRVPGSRIGFMKQGRTPALFVNGRQVPLSASLAFAAPFLSGQRRFTAHQLSSHLGKSGFLLLLGTLIRSGAYRLEH